MEQVNKFRGFTSKIPSWVWFGLKCLLSVGMVVWLVLSFNWKNVMQTISAMPWQYIAAWLLIWACAYCLMGVRLRSLLAAQKIHLGLFYSIQLVFIGAFTGNFMPSSMGGDAFKFVYLARGGYGKSVTGAAVVLDRMLNILATVFFLPFAFMLPGLLKIDQKDTTILLYWILAILFFIIVAVLGVLLARKKMKNIPLETQAKSTILSRTLHFLRHFIDIFLKWIDHPWTILYAMLVSLGLISLCFVGGWIVARGMGIEISLVSWFAIQACLSVLVILPISLNGLGLQEISLVYLMSLVGVPEGKSLALALLLRVLIVLFSLFGAIGLIAEKQKANGTQRIADL